MTGESTADGEAQGTRTATDRAEVLAPGAGTSLPDVAPAGQSIAAGPAASDAVATGAVARTGGASGWLLLGAIVGCSAALGWFAGRQQGDDSLLLVEASFLGGPPGEGAEAPPDALLDTRAIGRTDVPADTSREIGRLKGEMLRLRVLFQRLAEAAELDDDGEFDVDFEIDSVIGDGEPLSALDPTDAAALSLLSARFDPMMRQSERMDRIFRERRQAYDRRLSGRPLANGRLSSGFGHRVDPLTGRQVMHRGLDFVGEVGDPILALADGVVTFSGPNGGYGLLVELEHAGGFKTRYAHNDSNLAELGDVVSKGQPIATLGSSGRSTGPHLHLEVRERGRALDPRYYVR